MSFNAGTAFVQVVPSFEGFASKIDEECAKDGESAGSAFKEAFRSAVGNLSVRVGLDDAAATAQVDEFGAKLDELGARSPSAKASLDDGEAKAKLDALKAKLDEYGTKNETAKASIDTSGGIFGISGLIGAIGAIGPAAIAAAGVAIGAFAAIPAALGGIALGGGAAFLGLSPVIKALTNVPQPAGQAAGAMGQVASAANAMALAQLNASHSAQTAAQQVVSAQAAVVTAQQAVVSANNGVTNSEQSLTNAQFTEQQAQVSLTAARKAAADQLQTYQNQLADGALAAQQAQLNLAAAQQNLVVVTAGASTPLQIKQAQLGVQQAAQAVKDQATQYGQLKDAAALAAKQGVDGATSVVNAQHGVVTAQQGVASATQAVTNAQQAQTNATTALNRANVAVTQALANQTFQAQLNDLTLKQAAQSATNAGVAAANTAQPMSALGKAMSQLTPTGQAFVNFIKSQFLPVFASLSAAAQNNLLPGIQAGLVALEPFFKVVAYFIGIAAQGIGDFVTQLGIMLGTQPNLGKIFTIFQSGSGFMSDLGNATLSVVQALINIGSNKEAVKIVKDIGGGIANGAKAFANFTASKGFTDFLAWILKNAPIVGKVIGDIFKILAPLVGAIAELGAKSLKVIDPILRWVEALLKAHPIIAKVVAAVLLFGGVFVLLIAPIIAAIAAMDFVVLVVIGVIAGIAELVVTVLALVKVFEIAWGAIRDAVVKAWQYIDDHVVHPVADFFTNTIPRAIDTAVGFFSSLPGRAGSALSGLWGAITGAFGDVAGWVSRNILDPVVNFFTGLPQSIVNALSGLAGAIGGVFKSAFNGIADIWNNSVGSLSFTIPGWVPVVGGDKFGFPKIPKLADGGPVTARNPFIVGEVGPELFIPEGNGQILSNKQLADLLGRVQIPQAQRLAPVGAAVGPHAQSITGMHVDTQIIQDASDYKVIQAQTDFALRRLAI